MVGTPKLCQNICLQISTDIKKKTIAQAKAVQKMDFGRGGAIWIVPGRMVATNYVKIIVFRVSAVINKTQKKTGTLG